MSKDSLDQIFGIAYPAEAPSESGRRRAVDAALIHDQRVQRSKLRRSGLRVAFGAAVGVVAIVATITLMPKSAAAALISDVSEAMDGARNVHMTSWSMGKDGTRVKSQELWYEGGKWRIDDTRRRQFIVHDGR